MQSWPREGRANNRVHDKRLHFWSELQQAALRRRIDRWSAIEGEQTLSPETWTDHCRKCLYLGLRHLVGSSKVMGGKQERLLNPCFLSRLQEALSATFWWSE
jgi:hypothetical protein